MVRVFIFHHQGSFWQKHRPLLISLAVIVISYIPWLPIFSYQFKQVGAGYWIPPMDIWSIPSTLYTLLVGFGHDVSQSSVQKLLVGILLIVVIIVYRFLKRPKVFTNGWFCL